MHSALKGPRCRPRQPGLNNLILVGIAAVMMGVSPAAHGDQVIAPGVNYTDVTITDLVGGRLTLKRIGDTDLSIWLCDADRITVDAAGAFLEFNQAERFLADDNPAKAIVRYRRALRAVEGMWADLIEARLVTACDRAQRTADAALHLIRVVRGRWTGPALAARIIPRAAPADRAAASAAVEHLDAALAEDPPLEMRIPLQMFRYEILRNSQRLDAGVSAELVSSFSIPEGLRCDRVFQVLLPALTQALDQHADVQLLASLDRAIRYCQDELLPSFLLLKGAALLRSAATSEDYIRAAWPYMRVAIHMPRDPRAADGLRGAALALEHIGRSDQAIQLLTECLAHKKISVQTRRQAREALARLQPHDQGP